MIPLPHRTVPRSKGSESNPLFFKSQAEYRSWLEKHHDKSAELWIGFWRKSTGKPSLTWEQVVDESLCFGWIDGIRKSIDADSFKQRVTPRRSTSIWSQINIRKIEELTAAGRMHQRGLDAFQTRDPKKTYSWATFDRVPLGPAYIAQFKKNRKAWSFWEAQPPGYRKLAGWYVMSAKQEDTRQRRLAVVMKESAAGRRIGPAASSKKQKR